MALFAYVRVSTDHQAQSGAGLAAQEDACQRVAGALAGVFREEGVSGTTGLDQRPQLLALLTHLRKGDALIVAKRDRLGRDPLVVAMIESAVKRKGARIVSAAGEGTDSDEPSQVLMRRMVDAFAEYERLIIGARTKAALQAKKQRGERTGSIAYGWKISEDGKTLIPHSPEQEILALVRQLKHQRLKLREVGECLAAAGHRPRGGVRWHPQTIKNLLAAVATE